MAIRFIDEEPVPSGMGTVRFLDEEEPSSPAPTVATAAAPSTPNDYRSQDAQEAAFSAMATETYGPRFKKYLKVYGTKRAGEYANQLDLLIDDYPLYADKIDSMINRAYDPKTIKKIIESQVRAEQGREQKRRETEARVFVKKATSGITDPVQAENAVKAAISVERAKALLAQEQAKEFPNEQRVAELTEQVRGAIKGRTTAQTLPTDKEQLFWEEAQPRGEAAGRAIKQSAIPTTVGAAGSFGAAKAMAGKVSTPVAVVGALAAGAASSMAAGKAQNELAREVLGEEKYNEWIQQLAQDREKYPGTVFAAEQLPGLAVGRINTAQHKIALDAARKVVSGGAKTLTTQEISALGNNAFGGSVGATMELVRQVQEGQIRPLELAAAFVLNTAVNASAFDGARPTGKLTADEITRTVTPAEPGRYPTVTRTPVNVEPMDVKTGNLSRADLLPPVTKPLSAPTAKPTPTTEQAGTVRNPLDVPVAAEATVPAVGTVTRKGGVSRIPGEDPVPIAYPKGGGERAGIDRRFLTRAQKPTDTPPEVLESLAAVEPQTYEQHATGKALEDTKAWIAKSGDNVAAAERIVYSDDPPSAKKGVTAVALLDNYRKTGNVEAETKLTEHMDRQFRESGRFIQAASFWAKMSGGGMKKSFRNFLKDRGVTLTDQQLKEIDAKFDAAGKMPDGEEKMAAVADAVNFATQSVPVRWGDTLDAYRYSNMLSNPRAHERNIVGNTFNAVITRPLSLLGQGEVRGAGTYLKNAATSLGDAWTAAKDAWATTQASKFVEGGILPGKSTFESAMNERTPRIMKIIPKALYAQDQFFGKLIEAGETARLVKKGIKAERAAEEAKALSDRYLYREKLGEESRDASLNMFSRAIDGLGAGVESMGKYPIAGKALRWFVPFLKTPINIAKLGVDASPLAYVGLRRAKSGRYSYPALTMNADDIAKAKFGKDFKSLQEADKLIVKTELKERQGMAMSGSLATLAGAFMAAEGRTTWAAPQDEKQKELFYASGRKPYSVLIGDKWVPMATFGPYALALAIPAAARDSFHDDPKTKGAGYGEKMADMAMGLSNFYVSQTPVSGLASFFDAIQGKGDWTTTRALGFIGTQFVPASGLVRYVNQWIDPYFRRPSGFTETLKADWPILNRDIDTYKGPDGEPALRTAADVLPPYSIGTSDPSYEGLYQDRSVVLRSRAANNRQVDGFVSLIRSKKIDREELDMFLSALPEDERDRLIARVREKTGDEIYSSGKKASMNVPMPTIPGVP